MRRAMVWLVAALMLGLNPAIGFAQQTPGPSSTVVPSAPTVGEYDGPQGDVGVHWVVEGLSGELGTPVVAGDLVLLRQGSTLVAYTQNDGEVAWEFSLDTGLSEPGVDDSRVYVAGGDRVIALDIGSGEVAWETGLWFGRESYQVDSASTQLVAPAIADGTVYAVAGPLAYALDAKHGNYIWRQAVPNFEALTPPVVTTTSVVFSGRYDETRNTAVGLAREDGAVLWPMFGSNASLPAALHGTVPQDDVIVSMDEEGDIVAQNATTGGYLWYRECFAGSESPSHIAVVGRNVLTACSGRIQVFDLISGDLQREIGSTDATVLGAFGPVLAAWDDAGASDVVRAIDPGTVDDLWTHAFPVSEPGTRVVDGTVGNGRVFVTGTNDDGAFLLAIGGTDGPNGASLPVLLNPPAAGTFASLATETDLRAAPSAEGAVWATLPPNTQLLITGAIEEVDGTTWWEVVLPETGDIGWVEPAAFRAAGDD